MELNIGLDKPKMNAVVTILNRVLADEFVLYTKTLNYHWNVVGRDFYEFHELFGKQYSELAEIIDDVAERARALGGRAIGTLKEFSETSSLKEKAGEAPDASAMLSNLLKDHEALIRNLRDAVDKCAQKHGDAGTADFLTGWMEQHEKMAWMLRSFLAN